MVAALALMNRGVIVPRLGENSPAAAAQRDPGRGLGRQGEGEGDPLAQACCMKPFLKKQFRCSLAGRQGC